MEIIEEKFIRKCPKCDEDINYSGKGAFKLGIKNNTNCKSCTARIQLSKIHEEIKNGLREPLFKGKKHTQKTIDKILTHPNRKTWTKHDNCIGKDNHWTGKHKTEYLLELWTDKYGLDEAKERMKNYHEKLSKATKGINNPMFGKPSPIGSGNGWSGWYKNWYFRSIHELSFMILYIERFNFVFNSENVKIPYIDYKNTKRNYFPDFILNDKYMIEIKPKKLHSSIDVINKKNAAIIYCKNHNMIYKLISPILLNEDKIINLYLSGDIKFIEKYDAKFKQKYLKNKSDK